MDDAGRIRAIEEALASVGVSPLAPHEPDGWTDHAHAVLALLDDGELSDPNQMQLGPFARDSQTSRSAALDNYPRQGTQRWRILKALESPWVRGVADPRGLTRPELAHALQLAENTIRPRIVELKAGGWVVPLVDDDITKIVTRKTATGSDAEVLVLTAKAQAALHARAS